MKKDWTFSPNPATQNETRTEAEEWHRLELRSEHADPVVEAVLASLSGSERREQLRHYLDGQPLHAGDLAELRVEGQWQIVRYEWTFRRADPLMLIGDNSQVYRIEAAASEVALRWSARDDFL